MGDGMGDGALGGAYGRLRRAGARRAAPARRRAGGGRRGRARRPGPGGRRPGGRRSWPGRSWPAPRPPGARPAGPRRSTSPTASGAPWPGWTATPGAPWARPWRPGRCRGSSPSGPTAAVLALSGSPAAARPLTRVGRTGDGWAPHPVALTGPAREGRLAGDGGRYAVVVDRPPALGGPGPGAAPPARCRLTLIDVPAGAVAATSAVCGPDHLLTGLALEGGPAGPVAYLALWHLRPPAPGGDAAAPDRPAGPHGVLAVRAQTGAPVAVLPLAGVPGLLAAGPAPGRLGRRLYAVERLSGPEDDPPAAVGARLLGLHPTTLEVESERRLAFVPARLVVAPDGDAVYALHDHRLTRLGLDGGPDRSVALPERGLALAVTRERVYVSSAYGPELWAFRRRDGRLVATIRVGQVAADLVTSPGG